MSPRNPRRQRVRIRGLVTVRIVMSGTEPPKRRTNRHGYLFANEARFHRGRQKAEAMAHHWERAGLVFPRHRAAVVALVSGTTRAAVYQRMYRYRRGLYSRSNAHGDWAGRAELRISNVFVNRGPDAFVGPRID